MARNTFIMNRIMRRIVLSEKLFIPLVIGFDCSVPAIMSARALESENDRKLKHF
jgi:ferrous iron transport protein B